MFSDTDRDHYVSNVAGHLGGAKSAEVKARQRTSISIFCAPSSLLTCSLTVSVYAAVDQTLSDRIADAIGAPRVKPLKVKPAAEAIRFKVSGV